ncbi:MAG: ABC transporter substrate-binding protein [Candidatus Poribacteria bacterium]|nr:ABC transporter substrate-binding protein [Candidatus Poribacteria bacterium]MDE0504583.1 ABC transporter substrate-binding protein [Candidatus Poribacteria bacterium]
MPISLECSSPPQYGGNLRHAVFQRVTTLDNSNYLNYAELQIASQLYEGLVRHDGYGDIASGVAKSWEHSPDYRTWTFTIAENARFHDEVVVRATDVQRAWERYIKENWLGEVSNKWLNPLFSINGASNFRRGNSNTVSGIEVLDDCHLQVTLEEPDDEFLMKLTGPAAHIAKPDIRDGRESFPLGTSRFRLASIQPEEIRIKANADYSWGKPYLEEITFHYYGGVRLALFDFESGVLDALHLPITETFRRRRDDSSEILIQAKATVGVYLRRLSGQSDPPAWYDVLEYALDVDELLRMQYGAPSTWATVTLSPRRFNPVKARRRLKNSPAVRLTFAPLPDNSGSEIATRLQRDFFSPIGLQVSMVDTGSEPLGYEDADLALLSVPLPSGADTVSNRLSRSDDITLLYLLPSNLLCQPRLRNLNIGWGGVLAFDQAWLLDR